jgi:hypothetical protein
MYQIREDELLMNITDFSVRSTGYPKGKWGKNYEKSLKRSQQEAVR